MKKDDRGFTLVELLVVIAIIGILSGVVIGSVAMAKSADALAAANRFDAFLARTRIGCMGRQGQVCMTLTLDENKRVVAKYYEGVTSEATPPAINTLRGKTPAYSEVIGGSGVSLQYKVNGDESVLGGTIQSTTVSQCILQFDRDTGALTSPLDNTSKTGNCVFTFTGGGRSHTVTIYADTGSHKVD